MRVVCLTSLKGRWCNFTAYRVYEAITPNPYPGIETLFGLLDDNGKRMTVCHMGGGDYRLVGVAAAVKFVAVDEV
jgi:hypothetical protein